MELSIVEQHILNELLAIRQKQEEMAQQLANIARLEERQIAHKADVDRAFEEIRRQDKRIDSLSEEIEDLKTENATKKPFWNIISVLAAAIVGSVVTKYLGI